MTVMASYARSSADNCVWLSIRKILAKFAPLRSKKAFEVAIGTLVLILLPQ